MLLLSLACRAPGPPDTPHVSGGDTRDSVDVEVDETGDSSADSEDTVEGDHDGDGEAGVAIGGAVSRGQAAHIGSERCACGGWRSDRARASTHAAAPAEASAPWQLAALRQPLGQLMGLIGAHPGPPQAHAVQGGCPGVSVAP